MTRFLMMRFAMTLATLLAVSVLVFSVARIQGDPRVLLLADQFGGIDPVQWEAMGKDLGLDKSPVHQYFIFLGKILRGDLGRSVWHAKPVGSIIAERLPATLQLALAGLAFAVVTGVPLGVLAAVKRGTIWDQMARGFALIGQAAPSFWIGILLIFIFGVSINLLPTSRKGDITHFIMPAIAVGWFGAAGLVRLIRSAMIEALDSEFVKFARAKGVMRIWTIWKHALRNALIPPLTFAGLLIAALADRFHRRRNGLRLARPGASGRQLRLQPRLSADAGDSPAIHHVLRRCRLRRRCHLCARRPAHPVRVMRDARTSESSTAASMDSPSPGGSSGLAAANSVIRGGAVLLQRSFRIHAPMAAPFGLDSHIVRFCGNHCHLDRAPGPERGSA